MSDGEGKEQPRGDQLDETVSVIKALTIGGRDPMEVEGSNQVSVDEQHSDIFNKAGAIEPPYSPAMLCRLFEHSEGLRPPVDSYCVNIDGFGHDFQAAFDLESEEDRRILATTIKKNMGPRLITEEVRKAFRVREEIAKDGDDKNTADGNPNPTNEEIRDRFGPEFAQIADDMAEERADLVNFFQACCSEMSFVKLRRNTRQDLEITGNGYWEVIRNAGEELSQFVWLPSFSMRLMPLGVPITVNVPIKQNDLSYKKFERRKRFRRFVQVLEKHTVYFKEYGDPRVMSATSGIYYDTVEALHKAEDKEDGAKAVEATEVKHFKLDSPRSSYGVPRWIGALLSVFGSRMANEINFLYFDNKGVPPLAMLVSGGHITKESTTRIQDFVNTELKGRTNFHKILILEAEPATGTTQADASRVKIELRPLTSAQQQDALFQKYDERNLDKIGNMFRLPRLLRGDIRDFNRSTAMAALNFTEMQVFQPEREDFDFVMNREFFADMEVKYWTFESLAPVTRDPTAMSTMIKEQSAAGNLVPEESRDLLQDVFNRSFKRIDQEWTKFPLPLTLAGVQQGATPDDKPTTEGVAKGIGAAIVTNVVKELLALRGLSAQAEQKAYDQIVPQIIKDADEGDDDKEMIAVPVAVWEEMVKLDESKTEAGEQVPEKTDEGSV